ncbi:MAG: hypothetical protein HFJ34_06135 [Clostridia bacterium]|nr:hypothetical protein [Clostridia bacterium]
MEKSAKKELIIYSMILVIVILLVITKNFIFNNKIEDNNKVENIDNQTSKNYLAVNNVIYNTTYEEEWMGEV